MRTISLLGLFLLSIPLTPAVAQRDLAEGRELFIGACAACHSLEPGRNMTGPSLAGLWGREAGSLQSFPRYSLAIKDADVVWTDRTLDQWLTDPKGFIPGNRMIYPGLPVEKARADLIAFLKQATQSGEGAGMQGMGMMMGTIVPSLKSVAPASQVREIRYCGETYTIATADGQTIQFWERNLRFKTDASDDGPTRGMPTLIGAGMIGDRASVIFAAPEEISQFIKRQC